MMGYRKYGDDGAKRCHDEKQRTENRALRYITRRKKYFYS